MGHFYSRNGVAQHTVRKSDGSGLRDSHVGDARKNDWLPGVTDILKEASKPFLERWKIKQAVYAALTIPREPDESTDDFLARIFKDADEQSKKARDRGSAVHDAYTRFLHGQEYPSEYSEHVKHLQAFMDAEVQKVYWSEKILVAEDYAGTADLFFQHKIHGNVLGDFKGQDLTADRPPVYYEEFVWQLSAYVRAHELNGGEKVDCAAAIVFDRTTGVLHPWYYSRAELDEGYRAFEATKTIWQIRKKYTPGAKTQKARKGKAAWLDDSNESFDVFMPVAPKDYGKLKYVIGQIRKNLEGFDKIYISVQDASQLPQEARELGLEIVQDRNVLDIDISRFKYRPNWIYQQYLKLFQNVTQNDLYFTIDSDVFINRKIRMFQKNRRVIWMGWEQNHPPYFRFQEKVLGLPRVYPHTFINDTNFFDKKIIREMLDRNGFTLDSIIEKSFEVINSECFPAEPEIYGQYVYKYHPNLHVFKQAKTKMIAKEISHTDWRHQAYSEAEIRAYIRDMESLDVDFFMLHSWFTRNEVQT